MSDRERQEFHALYTVARQANMKARGSVRIARGCEEAQEGPVRVVVGVDGSTHAEAAVEAVATRHWPAGSEAWAIIAVDRALATAPRRLTKDGGDDRQWALHVIESAVERLRSAGLIATPLVMEGDPKRLLVAEAEARQADSMFVGARGVRGIERFLLGSVSAAVAARAPCSVEVVRLQRDE
jgi:nucleotide-binding universal stress UspA family protein